MTKKSRDKLAFTALATDIEFKSLITLTYPSVWPESGKICKEHLNTFLVWLRNRYDVSYIWIVEFQTRGAPHYHIMTSVPEPSEGDRIALARQWRSVIARWIWGGGLQTALGTYTTKTLDKLYSVHVHPEAWEAIRKPNGASRYLISYALKPEQKGVPKEFSDIGRFWGTSRDVKRSIFSVEEIDISEDELRLTLETMEHQTSSWPVLPRYIFGLDVSRET